MEIEDFFFVENFALQLVDILASTSHGRSNRIKYIFIVGSCSFFVNSFSPLSKYFSAVFRARVSPMNVSEKEKDRLEIEIVTIK